MSARRITFNGLIDEIEKVYVQGTLLWEELLGSVPGEGHLYQVQASVYCQVTLPTFHSVFNCKLKAIYPRDL